MIHHRYRVLLLILCCPLIWPASAGAAIPSALKTSTPLPSGGAQQVDAFVQSETAKLIGTNASLVSSARKALMDEADTAAGPGGTGATADYQTAYAQSVIKAMTPLLTDQKQRLNAAVVLGGVAAKVSRTKTADVFAPVGRTMLTDKFWPVTLWGVKVARYALANTLENQKKTTLPADIVAAVKANENSGYIVEEAYLALVLDGLKTDPGYGTYLSQTLPSILELIEWRTTLFKAGGTPVAPDAESGPANALPIYGFDMISAGANTALKARVLKALGDFTAAELAAISGGGSADPDLVTGAEQLGNAISAFGAKLANKPLADAGADISKMGSTPQQATVDRCKDNLSKALDSLASATQ